MSLLRTLRRCARALAAPLLLTPLLACAPHALARPSPAADQTLAPYFVTEGGSAAALPLKSTRAQVTISGTIADVVVTQVYRNEGEAPLEARYVFPASSRAAVHALRLRVGERAVDAVVREKRQAQAEYAQARREGKSAALLEQQRPNVFTMAIANVMPGDEIAVDLRYTETLLPTDGTYRFVYPTVVGPRHVGTGSSAAAGADGPGWGRVAPESSRADARPPAGGPSDRPADSARATAQPSRPAQAHPAGSAQPFFRQGSSGHATFALDVRVLSPLPIASVTSPSHPIAVSGLGSTEARLKLDAAAAHANRDVVIDYRLAGATIDAGLMVQRGHSAGDENFFLLMAQPPARVPGDAVLPREYVFIVDVSGSMHGFPLDTAKALLRDLVGRLRPGDTFNVIPFAGGSSLLHPQSLPASEENIARALRFIDGQTGGGGTELLPALRRALAMPSDLGRARSFVVVTDGYVTIEKEAFDLVRRELGQANLFAFGIGSSVNRFLIEGLARAGKGEPFFVLKPLEAAAAAQRFREYVERPVMSRIRVRFEGFDAYDLDAPQLPDLFAQRPLVLMGKFRGEPQGTVVIEGLAAGGAVRLPVDVKQALQTEGTQGLRYLWARSRIAELGDYSKLGAGDAAIAEITALGLKYNLLTDYTSFVAVDKVVRNPGGAGRSVEQPSPLPEGVSELAVGAAPATPEPEFALLAALAGGLTWWLRRRRPGVAVSKEPAQ